MYLKFGLVKSRALVLWLSPIGLPRSLAYYVYDFATFLLGGPPHSFYHFTFHPLLSQTKVPLASRDLSMS